MRVRFLIDYKVKAEKGETYKKGEIVDFDVLSAQHFLNRQVVVIAESSVEQARLEAPEKAVMPSGRPRKMKDVAADQDAG